MIIYDIDSNQSRIIRGDFIPNYLSWSPDGTKIAFSDIQHDDVAILDLSTESYEVVDSDGHWIDGPVWSLDGRYLAYVQTKGKDTNNNDAWVLKLLDLETMEVSQITTANDNIGIMRDKKNLLWTADGQYLIYVRFGLSDGKRQPYELWILDPISLATHKLEKSTLVVNQSYYPWIRQWSPNTEEIFITEPVEKYITP